MPYRAVFDADIRFSNGGGLHAEGFRVDLPGPDATPEQVAELFVRSLDLLLTETAVVTNLRIVEEPHRGTRGGPSDPRGAAQPDPAGDLGPRIRNVVLGRLREGVPLEAIEPGLRAIVDLAPPGLLSCRVGTDLRARDGSWDFAITSDFADLDAYRAYDLEAEHNRIRRELIGPLCADIARVQFAI